ncbi:16S rRNA (guanine(966)-N(2))-methyltransferase RsmD [Arthrobacter mobilis]|uniref:16S rRNA (Guanine(966)-N(2))-methyltransferase RsmD n=1 Tax=Arthrobacter mobilis TaxID=2724944 RepID=A0A7X6K691_9MICC|nr:16S rRNA (guanine(966)-N(2))-methyltransferase RsmD [Arthrobacter mobilis]NKX55344.1 16S rRNA (guanine(966)-N(2))-methyltransferase RsmD [Arthrobacter mobilis]
MSRIIAGVAGGISLANVPGDRTRPTTDRVKEALFSRLDSYGILAGARVLDLFAGSGALGVESASRGAAEVDLVELSEKAAAVCRRNAELVNKALGRTVVRVSRSGVQPFLDRLHSYDQWDLVLMDPPYTLSETELAEVLASLSPRLADGAVVVVERSSRSPEPVWPDGLERFADKKYGETRLWYAEPARQ